MLCYVTLCYVIVIVRPLLSPVSIQTQSLALRALRLDGNRAKRKRLRWQAAHRGCHCFDRASYWLLTQRTQRKRLRMDGNRA